MPLPTAAWDETAGLEARTTTSVAFASSGCAAARAALRCYRRVGRADGGCSSCMRHAAFSFLVANDHGSRATMCFCSGLMHWQQATASPAGPIEWWPLWKKTRATCIMAPGPSSASASGKFGQSRGNLYTAQLLGTAIINHKATHSLLQRRMPGLCRWKCHRPKSCMDHPRLPCQICVIVPSSYRSIYLRWVKCLPQMKLLCWIKQSKYTKTCTPTWIRIL